jgi:DNA-binding MarR family transcriptional regulator
MPVTATATAAPTAAIDADLIQAAYEVWKVMHREAKNRGLARTRHRELGDGRVLINTVGAFINGLSKERGWNLDKGQVDLVRRYLKRSGNVVVLEKVEQYRFRIFVREEWSNEQLLRSDPDRPKTPEQRLTATEAGEDRSPAPVTHKCATCGRTFKTQPAVNAHQAAHKSEPRSSGNTRSQPLGAAQRKVLGYLAEHGPVEDSRGLVSTRLAEGIGESRPTVSGSLQRLDAAGFVYRHVHGKRTLRVELSPSGEKEVARVTGKQPKSKAPDPEPVVRHPNRAGAELPRPALADVDHDALVEELFRRLGEHGRKAERDLQALQDRLSLIRDLIGEVNAGTTPPLKALADIETAVEL